jgi:hypothetical protein
VSPVQDGYDAGVIRTQNEANFHKVQGLFLILFFTGSDGLTTLHSFCGGAP